MSMFSRRRFLGLFAAAPVAAAGAVVAAAAPMAEGVSPALSSLSGARLLDVPDPARGAELAPNVGALFRRLYSFKWPSLKGDLGQRRVRDVKHLPLVWDRSRSSGADAVKLCHDRFGGNEDVLAVPMLAQEQDYQNFQHHHSAGQLDIQLVGVVAARFGHDVSSVCAAAGCRSEAALGNRGAA